MKVLLDYFIFDGTTAGGIYRYYYNLIQQAQNFPDWDYELGCLFGETVNGKNELGLKPKTFSHPKLAFSRNLTRNITKTINVAYSLGKIGMTNYDILHPTYPTLFFKPILERIKKPLAVTVYDMIPELFPEYKTNKPSISEKKLQLCKKADIIFAISEQTKLDLVRLFKIPADKIKVTYLAGGFSTNQVNPQLKSRLPQKYLLFVGWRNGYKNFQLFFKSIIPLLQKDHDLSLVCTGPGFSQEELALFSDHGLSRRVIHHFANDSEFYTLFHFAEAFIFPSLYEGFGIPVLEAFSCQCPVVLSHNSSLIEVGGDAVQYVDPLSEDSIRSNIENVIYNSGLRNSLIQKGNERLNLFSWEKTAAQTYEGYKSILR